MELCKESKSYTTRDRAIAKLFKLLTNVNLSPAEYGVRWLVVATGDGRFAPVVLLTPKVQSFMLYFAIKMLYTWIVGQIKAISAQERRHHFVRTNEHIDPLRWQVQFGLGAVQRLGSRLRDMRELAASEAGTAIALSHRSEISDWLESQGRSRIDGKESANSRKWREERERLAKLKEENPEAYYFECPWDRPLSPEAQAAQDARTAKANAKWERKWAAQDARAARRRRPRTEEELRKEEQEYQARSAGRINADRINLQPFIEGQTAKKEVK